MKQTRRNILDATIGVIRRDGYPGLSVVAIAAYAGVTRPTVYANFGSLDDLVSIAVTERAVGILASIAEPAETHDDPVDYTVELIVGVRSAVRRDAVLSSVLYAQADSRLLDADVVDKGLATSRQLLDRVALRSPALREDRLALDELLVRIALSAIMFSSSGTVDDTSLGGLLRRWLAPLLLHRR